MKTNKLLLIGQAPGRTGDPSKPLSSLRIAKTFGWTMQEYERHTERINLINRYPGRSTSKGDLFPLGEAREAADKIKLDGRKAILFGKGVARAFRIKRP